MKSIILIIFIFCGINLHATGPSSISSEIHPISVNEKGDILCRTRFEENWMGAHAFMVVEYGLCVISNDTIIEYLSKQLIPYLEFYSDLDEKYNKERKHWDEQFKTCLNYNKLSKTEGKLVEEYGFNECNCDPYKVDKTYSFLQFKNEKHVDLKSNRQKTLKNTNSRLHYGNIKVAYDFGKVLILDNKGEEHPIWGTNFNFQYPMHGTWFVYDYYDITGVLFLDKQ